MSNSDILSKADKALKPVLKELGSFPWVRLEGCCAGHKPEDSLWLEINVLGLTFGVDPYCPAFKLPMIGRLGVDQHARRAGSRQDFVTGISPPLR